MFLSYLPANISVTVYPEKCYQRCTYVCVYANLPIIMFLCNITLFSVVVQNRIDSLRRCQSVEEVQRLYEEGEYREVVTLLLQTFSQGSSPGLPVQERHAQLLLLQDSQLKLEDYKVWGRRLILGAANMLHTILTTPLRKATLFANKCGHITDLNSWPLERERTPFVMVAAQIFGHIRESCFCWERKT